MRNVSRPTSAPDASKRPPPLAPDVNAVSDSMIRPPSSECNACTRPNRSVLPVPPVKPMAATACPTCNDSCSPSAAGRPFQLGARRKQRSWSPSAYCPVTVQRLPPPEIRIARRIPCDMAIGHDDRGRNGHAAANGKSALFAIGLDSYHAGRYGNEGGGPKHLCGRDGALQQRSRQDHGDGQQDRWEARGDGTRRIGLFR